MTINEDKIIRIEVINHSGTSERYNFGRCFGIFKELNDFKSISFSLQDDGTTLKIFMK